MKSSKQWSCSFSHEPNQSRQNKTLKCGKTKSLWYFLWETECYCLKYFVHSPVQSTEQTTTVVLGGGHILLQADGCVILMGNEVLLQIKSQKCGSSVMRRINIMLGEADTLNVFLAGDCRVRAVRVFDDLSCSCPFFLC